MHKPLKNFDTIVSKIVSDRQRENGPTALFKNIRLPPYASKKDANSVRDRSSSNRKQHSNKIDLRLNDLLQSPKSLSQNNRRRNIGDVKKLSEEKDPTSAKRRSRDESSAGSAGVNRKTGISSKVTKNSNLYYISPKEINEIRQNKDKSQRRPPESDNRSKRQKPKSHRAGDISDADREKRNAKELEKLLKSTRHRPNTEIRNPNEADPRWLTKKEIVKLLEKNKHKPNLSYDTDLNQYFVFEKCHGCREDRKDQRKKKPASGDNKGREEKHKKKEPKLKAKCGVSQKRSIKDYLIEVPQIFDKNLLEALKPLEKDAGRKHKRSVEEPDIMFIKDPAGIIYSVDDHKHQRPSSERRSSRDHSASEYKNPFKHVVNQEQRLEAPFEKISVQKQHPVNTDENKLIPIKVPNENLPEYESHRIKSPPVMITKVESESKAENVKKKSRVKKLTRNMLPIIEVPPCPPEVPPCALQCGTSLEERKKSSSFQRYYKYTNMDYGFSDELRTHSYQSSSDSNKLHTVPSEPSEPLLDTIEECNFREKDHSPPAKSKIPVHGTRRSSSAKQTPKNSLSVSNNTSQMSRPCSASCKTPTTVAVPDRRCAVPPKIETQSTSNDIDNSINISIQDVNRNLEQLSRLNDSIKENDAMVGCSGCADYCREPSYKETVRPASQNRTKIARNKTSSELKTTKTIPKIVEKFNALSSFKHATKQSTTTTTAASSKTDRPLVKGKSKSARSRPVTPKETPRANRSARETTRACLPTKDSYVRKQTPNKVPSNAPKELVEKPKKTGGNSKPEIKTIHTRYVSKLKSADNSSLCLDLGIIGNLEQAKIDTVNEANQKLRRSPTTFRCSSIDRFGDRSTVISDSLCTSPNTTLLLTKTYRDPEKVTRTIKSKMYAEHVRKHLFGQPDSMEIPPQVLELRYVTVEPKSQKSFLVDSKSTKSSLMRSSKKKADGKRIPKKKSEKPVTTKPGNLQQPKIHANDCAKQVSERPKKESAPVEKRSESNEPKTARKLSRTRSSSNQETTQSNSHQETTQSNSHQEPESSTSRNNLVMKPVSQPKFRSKLSTSVSRKSSEVVEKDTNFSAPPGSHPQKGDFNKTASRDNVVSRHEIQEINYDGSKKNLQPFAEETSGSKNPKELSQCMKLVSREQFDELFKMPIDDSLNEILSENYDFLTKDFSFTKSPCQALDGKTSEEKIMEVPNTTPNVSDETLKKASMKRSWCEFAVENPKDILHDNSLNELYCNEKCHLAFDPETQPSGSPETLADIFSAVGSEESGYATLNSKAIHESDFFNRPSIKDLLNPPKIFKYNYEENTRVDSCGISLVLPNDSLSTICTSDIKNNDNKSMDVYRDSSASSIDLKISERDMPQVISFSNESICSIFGPDDEPVTKQNSDAENSTKQDRDLSIDEEQISLKGFVSVTEVSKSKSDVSYSSVNVNFKSDCFDPESKQNSVGSFNSVFEIFGDNDRGVQPKIKDSKHWQSVLKSMFKFKKVKWKSLMCTSSTETNE